LTLKGPQAPAQRNSLISTGGADIIAPLFIQYLNFTHFKLKNQGVDFNRQPAKEDSSCF